jgi:hypothetical protein
MHEDREPMQTIDTDQLSTITGGLTFDAREMHREASKASIEGAKIGGALGLPFFLFPIIPMGTFVAGAAVGYAAGATRNAVSQLWQQR